MIFKLPRFLGGKTTNKKEKKLNKIKEKQNKLREQNSLSKVLKLKEEISKLKKEFCETKTESDKKRISVLIKAKQNEISSLIYFPDLEYEDSKQSFRLKAKNLFLTYSRTNNAISDMTHQQIYNDLMQKFKSNLGKCIISFETSDKSYDHIHIYIELKRQLDTRNPHLLDIKHVHGKYESVRNKSATLSYLTKQSQYLSASGSAPQAERHSYIDGKYYTKGQMESDISMANKENFINNSKFGTKIIREIFYQETIEKQNGHRGLQNIVDDINKRIYRRERVHSKELQLIADSIKYKKDIDNLNNIYFPMIDYQQDKELFVSKAFLEALLVWIELAKNKYGNPKTYFLQGDKGTYKTSVLEHICGLENMLRIDHKDDAKDYVPSKHSSILFDDFDPIKHSREQLIKLTDSEQDYSMDVKCSKVTLCKSANRIITTNRELQEVLKNDGAINRRVHKAQLVKHKPKQIYYSNVFKNIYVYIKDQDSMFYNVLIDTTNGYTVLGLTPEKRLEQAELGNYYKSVNRSMLRKWIQQPGLLCQTINENNCNIPRFQSLVCAKQISLSKVQLTLEEMKEIYYSIFPKNYKFNCECHTQGIYKVECMIHDVIAPNLETNILDNNSISNREQDLEFCTVIS